MNHLVSAEDGEPAVGEELARQGQRKADHVEGDDRKQERLIEAPGDDPGDPSPADRDAGRTRWSDPVHDRLDVFDHVFYIEVRVGGRAIDRKAGPGWT